MSLEELVEWMLSEKTRRVPCPRLGTDCWEWTGYCHDSGYGHIFHDGKARSVHSLILEVFHGARPEGLIALHECDNRVCVNPAHLSWNTPRVNTVDCVKRGRWRGGLHGNGQIISGPEQVHRIRKRLAAGAPAMEIARDEQVSYNAVANIKYDVTWRWVK